MDNLVANLLEGIAKNPNFLKEVTILRQKEWVRKPEASKSTSDKFHLVVPLFIFDFGCRFF